MVSQVINSASGIKRTIGLLGCSLGKLSDLIVKLERPFVGLLIGSVFLVVLLNLVTRSLGWALFWADELAIYLMIWAALIGASTSVRLRSGIAVQLLTDYLPVRIDYIIRVFVDCTIFCFGLALIAFCWIWFDPMLLLESNFDIAQFKSNSYNFIYHEPTTTLQIQKFWVWLVVPLIALTISIHGAANFFETLGKNPDNLSGRE